MLLSAHQPAYLPWLGYFEKIARADVFIYMDTVQFERNSYTNRNKIKGPNGAQMLTIPVCMKGHMEKVMKDMVIDEKTNWRRKHLNSIFCNYKKAPYFEQNFPKLERLYEDMTDNFSELVYSQLLFWLDELHINTKIVRLQDLNITSANSDLVLDMCRATGADQYLSGALGKDYLNTEKFAADGIKVFFQDYHCEPYPQLWDKEFLPAMGVVDLWMNTKDYSVIINK